MTVVAGAAHDLVVAVDVLVLGTLAMGGIAIWLTARAVRRRLQRWRRVAMALPSRADAGQVVRVMASLPVTKLSWWTVQQQRHRMWRAVAAADRTVSSAVRMGAPVGDLPSLARRLRRNAADVERVLAATADSPRAARKPCPEVLSLLKAAESIQSAAAEALRTTAAPDTNSLAAAIATEVTALRHGWSVATLRH
jgi:hypothetical protein